MYNRAGHCIQEPAQSTTRMGQPNKLINHHFPEKPNPAKNKSSFMHYPSLEGLTHQQNQVYVLQFDFPSSEPNCTIPKCESVRSTQLSYLTRCPLFSQPSLVTPGWCAKLLPRQTRSLPNTENTPKKPGTAGFT